MYDRNQWNYGMGAGPMAPWPINGYGQPYFDPYTSPHQRLMGMQVGQERGYPNPLPPHPASANLLRDVLLGIAIGVASTLIARRMF